ncbi:protein JASON [Argentina anserina]|uniref:protein JASON n=1 Tax=Argentina anserina TaxID=57926 RepID=UPI00217627E4|nr:protein JASON [Potentilla anserina]
MLCFGRELGFVCRSVLRLLDRSVAGAMGCFFGCFRFRDDRHLRSRPHLVSQSSRSGAVVSQNRLASLFLDQEKGESPSRDRESPSYGTPQIDKELKNEAKFLKACGTIVETPVEIRRASKLNGSPQHDRDSGPSKFNSWLPHTSIKKLQQENQPEQPPTPVKLFEQWEKGSEHTPISYESNQQSTGRSYLSSTEDGRIGTASSVKIHSDRAENTVTPTSPSHSATDIQGRGKSVRFECDFDTASSKGSSSGNCRSAKIAQTPGRQGTSKYSDYPTPLTLSEDMQTPGTVYPSGQGAFPNGKSRIRSQYVYSVPYPEGTTRWNVLEEEDSNSYGSSGEASDSLKQSGNATSISQEGKEEISSGTDLQVESSMSAWLKPVTQDDNNLRLGDASARNHYFGRTPGDRPIIGLVATHWNEDDPTRISPKWWDGNGIPNSTNKYKEDQKVSWHATPFEERLEKALSEETFISQRKNIEGMPMVFDENEESDTALSQLQSSSQPKSVVSF